MKAVAFLVAGINQALNMKSVPPRKAKSQTVAQATASITPPRLCSIYLRDLVSFLYREEVELCREVSRHFHTTIQNTPTDRLPRFCFDCLDFDITHSLRAFRLKHSLFDKHTAQQDTDCCDGLKVDLRSFQAGPRITPN